MCAHAVRVAVDKIDGVTDASVSLNEGRVTVVFAPDNQVTVAEIRTAIRRQGFSPREAEIRISGTLHVGGAGGMSLVVPGSGVRYSLVVEGEIARRLAEVASGAPVEVRGRVGEDGDNVTPLTLAVLEIAGGDQDPGASGGT